MDFEPLYSRMARATKPSIIRSLLGLVQSKDIISLAGGTPDSSLFPLELFAEISRKVILENGRLALQYGESQGWKPLREQVAAYLATKGIRAELENIAIIAGSQQGIDLAARIFLDPGDTALMENPGYLGAMIAFRNYGALVEGLPVDQDGLIVEALEERLKRGPRPKLLYLTPTYQNPAGLLLPADRRKRVAELASQYGLPVIEDDPYGEVKFDEGQPPAIASHPGAPLIYHGTFSKIGVPGLRVGWVFGPKDYVQRVVLAKESSDVSAGVLGQALAAEFLKGGHLPPHLEKMRAVYKGRAFAMLDALKAELADEFKVRTPRGGFFLWAELAPGLDAGELLKRAVEKGVAFVPGSAFYLDEGDGKNALRLTFCAADEARIREGVRRLAGVAKAMLVKA